MQTVNVFATHCCDGVSILAIRENPRQTSEGNGTGADDDNRMHVDPVKKGTGKDKGKDQNKEGTLTNNNTSNTSNTDINTCKNCGRTGHWVKDCSRPGGRADNNSNNNDNNHNNNKNKGKNNRKGKGQGKQLEVLQTLPLSETASTATYQSQISRTTEAVWCNPDTQQKGWIMTLGGVTMSFTVSNSETSWCRRLAS